jgi:hypothetical protein
MSAVVVMGADELRTLIRDAVADALADRSTSTTPRLLDKQSMAAQLSCSPATLDRMAREGCPYVLVGSVRRFDPAAVVAWVSGRSVVQPEPAPVLAGVRLLSRRG